MVACSECGASSEGQFCANCGAKLASPKTARPKRMTDSPWFAVVVVGLLLAGAALIAWNVPVGHSDVTHHDANSVLSMKAYDAGAEFYLFNRCKMYVLVDGSKFTVPGDEQNGECTLANPADAFKLMAYTHINNN